jgi:hypothetical protein
MIGLGVPRFDTTGSVELAREQADELARLPADDPQRLTREVRDRIEQALPALTAPVEVAASPELPDTLVHNDLHGGNVFRGQRWFLRPRRRGGQHADAGLARAPGSAVDLTGCPADDPTLWPVVDAWIEVWSDVRPATELREAMPHAMRLVRLARNEAWRRATSGLESGKLGDFRASGTEWLGAPPEPPLLRR